MEVKQYIKNNYYASHLPGTMEAKIKRFEESIGEWIGSRRQPLPPQKTIHQINEKWKKLKKQHFIPLDMRGVGGLTKKNLHIRKNSKELDQKLKSQKETGKQLTLKL